jgi:3-oxoacyl-[acyl-carrier-protein] synthase III
MPTKIIGTGSYLPDNIVTNEYLATIMDTSDEWISSRTGIKKRRISTGETTAELAANAALKAIEDAKIKPEDIDYIFIATMSADYFLPNASSEVQNMIGAVNATCLDINAACSGFIFSLNTAHAYIESGLAKTVLVIGAEVLSKQLDWDDRSTCVLFGDGAGAVVVKKAEAKGIIDTVTGSDGSKKEALTCKTRSLNNIFVKEEERTEYLKMDGQEVFKFALTKVPECITLLLEKTKIDIGEIKYFVLHQANKRILDSVARRLKVSIDKFPLDLDEYGNTSAASIPILLDEINKQGKLKSGDKIIISGFGGGLTWGATLIQW